MILTGRSLCLPPRAVVQQLFSAAQDAGVVPDISVDPALASFLSVDSAAALRHQLTSVQRGMTAPQREALGLRLAAELGGARVTHGGVGVVALALAVLFEQVALQVRGRAGPEGDSAPQSIFGVSSSSRIGSIALSFLRLIPAVANDPNKMAESTEVFDQLLSLELLDHYERMSTKKRMSTVALQQWLMGAAIHLHTRIHQVRLRSVPRGSAESLRLSYKSALSHLIHAYTSYLRRNIQETPARPAAQAQTGSGRGPNGTACPALEGRLNSSRGSSHHTAEASCEEEEEAGGAQGLLLIEPGRNVSHGVQHHACQAPPIQQALAYRIIGAQDLDRNRDLFQFSFGVFRELLSQDDDFLLQMEGVGLRGLQTNITV